MLSLRLVARPFVSPLEDSPLRRVCGLLFGLPVQQKPWTFVLEFPTVWTWPVHPVCHLTCSSVPCAPCKLDFGLKAGLYSGSVSFIGAAIYEHEVNISSWGDF